MTFGLKQLIRSGLVLAAAFAVLTVQGVEGQRRAPGLRGGPDGLLRRGPATGAERALRLADEIELSDAQRSDLEALRLELVQERAEELVRMLELRSEVRAGMREPEALTEALRSARDAMDESRTQARERIDAVLTDEQRQRLDELGRSAGTWRSGPRGWRGRRGAPLRLRRMQHRWSGA